MDSIELKIKEMRRNEVRHIVLRWMKLALIAAVMTIIVAILMVISNFYDVSVAIKEWVTFVDILSIIVALYLSVFVIVVTISIVRKAYTGPFPTGKDFDPNLSAQGTVHQVFRVNPNAHWVDGRARTWVRVVVPDSKYFMHAMALVDEAPRIGESVKVKFDPRYPRVCMIEESLESF